MNTVLFTASTFSHIINFHLPYLRAFHTLGWQVHAACGGRKLPIPEADRVIVLPFEKKITSPENFHAQRQLQRLMEENHYSLICTHTSLAAFFTRRAVANLKMLPPVVNVVHGYLFDDSAPWLKRTVLREAERLTAPQTQLLLTMNQYDFEMARREKFGSRVQKIPGIGVDFSRFSEEPPTSRQALRKGLGLSDTDFAMIYAAEFSARKNQTDLIRALPALPPCVKLVFAGEGALLAQCRKLAHEQHVEDRVLFVGQVAEMNSCYRACDAAVSSSRSEGLPFNMMEAMYCGLPVIASAVKGHTDLIREGESGLLFSLQNPASFPQQVRTLLSSSALRDQLGNAAHSAVAQYELSRVLPIVMQAYLSAASEESAFEKAVSR